LIAPLFAPFNEHIDIVGIEPAPPLLFSAPDVHAGQLAVIDVSLDSVL
jgi:hypothetical protein